VWKRKGDSAGWLCPLFYPELAAQTILTDAAFQPHPCSGHASCSNTPRGPASAGWRLLASCHCAAHAAREWNAPPQCSSKSKSTGAALHRHALCARTAECSRFLPCRSHTPLSAPAATWGG
jgi:hypothetical protein